MSKKKHIFVIGLIIFLCFLFCLPLILPLNKVVVEESYLEFCSYLDVNLIHFVKDHKIPFWSFHFGGGYPFIKHPDNISLSPLFYLLILPFGSGVGLKLLLFLSYAVGAAGFYLFVNRILRYNLITSGITTMIFIFNSFIPFQLNTGNIKNQGWLYLPLITYILFLSKKKQKCIFYCACLMVFVLLNGLSLYFAVMLLFLFILIVLDGFSRPGNRLFNEKSLLINFFFILLITLFLGAIKIFPIVDLLKLDMRGFDQYFYAAANSMTFEKMILAFFSRGPYAVGNETVMGSNGLGMGSVMYFGSIMGGLFILSCVFCFKKIWKYLLVILIFICLSMAKNSPWDIFYILWHLPFFHSMHQPARYFSFPVIFMVPIIIGALFSSKVFVNFSKGLKFVVYLIAIIGIIDMFDANTKYYKFCGLYQESIPKMEGENKFFNVQKSRQSIEDIPFCDVNKQWVGKYADELDVGIQYYLIRQNIGLVDWSGKINLRYAAVPKYKVLIGYGDYWKDFKKDLSINNGIIKNEDYRGECFFVGDSENKVNNLEWKTNEIIIDVEQRFSGKLIVNQNYDKEWKSNVGKIYNANGRLGVILNKPENKKIRLYYCPKSFYLGLIISIVSIILCLRVFFKKKIWPFRNRKLVGA